ncbi:MAG TPA: hypothetical protein VHS78_12135 [Candidatus Elarobacter sp.]|jgi:hypothetical protein|nr:hypothetical protein [Candidatus Elarobacter sp.]
MGEPDHADATKRRLANVSDTLRSAFDGARVTKSRLRAAIERIAREDAEILEALGRGPLDTETSAS